MSKTVIWKHLNAPSVCMNQKFMFLILKRSTNLVEFKFAQNRGLKQSEIQSIFCTKTW
jgi:hypothetical protein